MAIFGGESFFRAHTWEALLAHWRCAVATNCSSFQLAAHIGVFLFVSPHSDAHVRETPERKREENVENGTRYITLSQRQDN